MYIYAWYIYATRYYALLEMVDGKSMRSLMLCLWCVGKGRNVRQFISRASDFWVVICHTKKFRPRRLRATCLLAYPAYHHHNNSVVDHRANNIGYKYSIIIISEYHQRSGRSENHRLFIRNTVLYYIIVRKAVM